MGSTAQKVKSLHHDKFVADLPTMVDKTVVITGTSTGLGLVAAKHCASKGATVYLLNRPSDRATAALTSVQAEAPEKDSILQIPCDLQDFQSVRDAAASVLEKVSTSGVDVLCNNAGVMAMPDTATKDGYDVQMQTNFLSHFLLTSLLMPALTQAADARGEARIVNHSSAARKSPSTKLSKEGLEKNGGNLGGDAGGARWERYHQSKLANALFTSALDDRLKAANSKVITAVAAPGLATSNLLTRTEDSGGGKGLAFIMRFAQSAEDGALPLISCMCSKDVASGSLIIPEGGGLIKWIIGDGASGLPKTVELESVCTDPESKALLWAESQAAVGNFSI